VHREDWQAVLLGVGKFVLGLHHARRIQRGGGVNISPMSDHEIVARILDRLEMLTWLIICNLAFSFVIGFLVIPRRGEDEAANR